MDERFRLSKLRDNPPANRTYTEAVRDKAAATDYHCCAHLEAGSTGREVPARFRQSFTDSKLERGPFSFLNGRSFLTGGFHGRSVRFGFN